LTVYEVAKTMCWHWE